MRRCRGTFISIFQFPKSGTFFFRPLYSVHHFPLLHAKTWLIINLVCVCGGGERYYYILKCSLLKSFYHECKTDLQSKVLFFFTFYSNFLKRLYLWFEAVTVYHIGKQYHFLVFSSNGTLDDSTLHFTVDLGTLVKAHLAGFCQPVPAGEANGDVDLNCIFPPLYKIWITFWCIPCKYALTSSLYL